MTIDIDLAQPADAAQAYSIFKLTWLDTYPNEEHDITVADVLSRYPVEKRQETIQKWQEVYRKLNAAPESVEMLVWLAKEDGQALGLVTIDKNAEPWRVGALYVLPEAQGRGVGTALLQHALQYAGTRPLELHAASYNTKALNFYAKFGFKIVGEIDAEAGRLPTGKIIPEVKLLRD